MEAKKKKPNKKQQCFLISFLYLCVCVLSPGTAEKTETVGDA